MRYEVQLKRSDSNVMAVALGLQAAEESVFVMSNHYTSTYPASPFVCRMICTLPTLTGRYTIRDTKLKIEENGRLTESELEARTFRDVLNR